MIALLLFNLLFQSTLLMRGATPIIKADGTAEKSFQSTLLMRGATVFPLLLPDAEAISIHAPHARSDAGRNGRGGV